MVYPYLQIAATLALVWTLLCVVVVCKWPNSSYAPKWAVIVCKAWCWAWVIALFCAALAGIWS